MIGALGVAGLLATVLALASSPATSQDVVTRVVTITTDDIPGSYTVSWDTRGGCDPSKPDDGTTVSTDGATGSITRTVSRPAGTDDDAIITTPDFNTDDVDPVGEPDRGRTVEFAIAIGIHCQYDWKASFTSGLPGDEGTSCSPVPGVRNGKLDDADSPQADGDDAGDDPDNEFTFDIVADGGGTECTVPGTIRVTVSPTPFGGDTAHTFPHAHDPYGAHTHGNVIARTQDHVHSGSDTTHTHDGGLHTHGTGSRHGTYTDTGIYELGEPTIGAILNTTFTVTATPVKNSDDECEAVTEETEVKDNNTDTKNDDKVYVELHVIQTTLAKAASCNYDVVVELPEGFGTVPGHNDSNERKVEGFIAFSATPDENYGTDLTTDSDATSTDTVSADCGDTVFTEANVAVADIDGDNTAKVACSFNYIDVLPSVAVAERSIYILQNVVGDSGGANARYSLTRDKHCAIPSDLPKNLESEEVGGIQTTKSVTIVELREGFFNISAAVMGRLTTDIDDYGRTFAPRYALNSDGEPCSFTAEVSHLPDICDAAEDSITANAVTGADSHGRVLVTFDIGCEEAMDDEDPMPTGGEDAGEEMVDDDGMPTGGEDAGEEMVDADPMGNMDDGDAMGPPPDEPTG